MPILGLRAVLRSGPGPEAETGSDVMLAGVYGDFRGRATVYRPNRFGSVDITQMKFTFALSF